MSTTFRTAGALALALAIGACSDAPTTAPANTSNNALAPVPATMARQATANPTAPVTGVAATSSAVGTFTGTATLQSVTASGGQLLGNVLIVGSAVVNGVTTAVSQTVQVPLATSGACPVLALDVGAIHLDLLGLVVDLAPIHLNITAQSGPGQLLGNLLCAVTHLLDGTGSGAGLTTAATNLLNQINGLLGAL